MKRKHNRQINFQDQIRGIVVCKYCSFETQNIDELDNHILSHEIKHEDVEEDFEEVTIVVDEMQQRKKPKKIVPDSYKCPVCQYETKRKHDLPKHLLTHSTAETTTIYKCSQCPYETKRKNDMPKHMLAHCTNVQMFKCPDCPYQTKRKSDLPKHLLCHKPTEQVPLYKCEYCEYVTKRKGDLPKHALNHKNGANLKLFHCSECEYKTKRKNDLHKHMLVHCDRHVAGVFKCLKCPYATDKVNKFSKHALSNCRYCYDAISLEHLMLEDIIGTVDEESVMMQGIGEEDEPEVYEEPLQSVDEGDIEQEMSRIHRESEEQHSQQNLPPPQQFQGIRYQFQDEVSKLNFKEGLRKKHGVFKINLGEFSYGNSQNPILVVKEEYTIEESLVS